MGEVGVIGRRVLNDTMPARRPRTIPRVVKRAISTYAARTAASRIHSQDRQDPALVARRWACCRRPGGDGDAGCAVMGLVGRTGADRGLLCGDPGCAVVGFMAGLSFVGRRGAGRCTTTHRC